ncbi:hypothetical protein LBW56_23595 [Ralstonia solanacearum]|uniref:hypothetical protein n=1 Tax=Ralstonia solanacearum TaxID=305 RepID=UPI001FF9D236|nr:hypothetical protein [Ralstonia solanacearum]MDB0529656.1 hypothetical protein [Ralstonia solanacearum]
MRKSRISIHFDGPIAKDHAIQLRTFTKTLGHIQSSIDRAYLDIKYDTGIIKNARLRHEDYEPTDFLMTQTREGGFIADLLGSDDDSGEIVKRINGAVTPAYEKANEQAKSPDSIGHEPLIDQVEKRARNYNAGAQKPIPYEIFFTSPDALETRAYGDRSIVKEFDQIASAIRARDGDGSFVEISLSAERALGKYVFDKRISAAFHDIVSIRSLGDLVEIPITLRSLDSGNGGISKAKAHNLVSNKEFNLHIHTDRGFSSLRGFLRKRNPIIFRIVACPIYEYEAFDRSAGDMYFITIIKN